MNQLNCIGLNAIGDNAEFSIDSVIDSVSLDAFKSCKNLKTASIPNALSIQQDAFASCSNLQHLVLPSLSAYDNIFGEYNSRPSRLSALQSIDIVDNGHQQINSLDTTVFANLPALTAVKFPATLTSINAAGAFAGTSLSSLKLVGTHLGDKCLSGMTKLDTLQFQLDKADHDIGLRDTSIRQAICDARMPVQNMSQFSQCTSLSSLEICNAQNIESLSSYAFYDCSSVKDIGLRSSSIKEAPSYSFAGCTSLTAYPLPENTVTALGLCSFSGCSRLNDLSGFNLHNVLSIEKTGDFSTFYAYNASGLRFIGDYALQNLRMSHGGNGQAEDTLRLFRIDRLGVGALQNLDSTLTAVSMSCFNQVVIPNSCFKDSASLKKVEICQCNYGNIFIISQNAFEGCTQLEQFVLSNYSTSGIAVKAGAFKCPCLTSLSFAKPPVGELDADIGWSNVTQISTGTTIDQYGDYYIPDWSQISSIRESYKKLVELFFNGREEYYDNSFKKDVVFMFSDGRTVQWDAAPEHSCFIFRNDNPNVLLSIDPGDESYQKFIQHPVLPSRALSIEQHAFDAVKRDHSTPQLNEIDLNCATYAGDGLLSRWQSLTSFTADFLQNAPVRFAYEDQSLVSFSMRKATHIGNESFCNCSRIQDIRSISNVRSIGVSAFAGCTSLTSVDAFGELTSVNDGAFHGCCMLQSASFPARVTHVFADVFGGCTKLDSLVLSSGRFIQQGSLSSQPSTLSVVFASQTVEDVLAVRGVECSSCYCTSKTFGSPKLHTKMFASDNNYTYPFAIVVPDQELAVVQDPSFDVVDDNGGNLHLQHIDQKFRDSTTVDAHSLFNISSIRCGAFKDSDVQSIHFDGQESRWTFEYAKRNLEDNVFTVENAPNISQLHFNEDMPSVDDWKAFFQSKTGDGKCNTIYSYFNDGCFIGDKKQAYAAKRTMLGASPVDIFTWEMTDGIKTITGVNDSLAQSYLTGGVVSYIDSSFRAISSFAFNYTQAVSKIETFADIGGISSNAFTWATSISNVILRGNSSNMQIAADAFSDSGVVEATVDYSTINGTSQISGYGLEDTLTLRRITYGDNVSAIAPSAMMNCRSNLTSVHFSPASLTSIGKYAFAETTETFPRLRDVNFSELENLEKIDDFAFYNSILTLNNGTLSTSPALTSIGTAAFSYDRKSWTQSLSSVLQIGASTGMIGGELKIIGPSAFMYNSFKNVSLGNKLTAIGDYAFAYPKHKFDISIPSSVKTIGEGAFKDNVILNPMATRKNIVKINNRLSSFEGIFGVTVSNYRAENRAGFSDATIISAFNDYDNWMNGFAYIRDNIMHFCPSDISIDVINNTLISVDTHSTSVYIPDYVNRVGPSAFMGCTALTSILTGNAVPGSMYYIDFAVPDYAFYNCTSLTNIALVSSVPSIGKCSFAGCQSITSFYDEDQLLEIEYWSLSSIDASAFMGCTSLSSYDLPRSLSVLSDDVFMGCTSLCAVHIDMTSQQFCDRFKENDSDLLSAVVKRKFSTVRSDNKCRIDFTDISYMNNGDIKIDNEFIRVRSGTHSISAFNQQDFIESGQEYLNLSSVDAVEQFVFYGASSLRSIAFLPNDSLSSIGDYAFYNCTNLASFNAELIPCTHIGCYAFGNCEKMVKATIPYSSLSSASIGQGAFFNTSLNTIRITGCPSSSSGGVLEKLKDAIGYDQDLDVNPLQLPDYCVFQMYNDSGELVGMYDYMLHSLLDQTVDINRNMLTFTNKAKESITPIALVKSTGSSLPAIVANTFHANIIGRWK